MTTLKEKIEIMQHYENGGEVEFYSNFNRRWQLHKDPSWNWCLYDYRKVVKPRSIFVNEYVDQDIYPEDANIYLSAKLYETSKEAKDEAATKGYIRTVEFVEKLE